MARPAQRTRGLSFQFGRVVIFFDRQAEHCSRSATSGEELVVVEPVRSAGIVSGMSDERRAYVVQVTKPDAALRGGLSIVLYVVLTSGPENAAAIVRRTVGEEADVEATGDALSASLARPLGLVPEQARLM